MQDDEDRLKYISNVPTICYQNHFEIEDSTFIFGGLCASEVNSFEHLGLPPNADLEKFKSISHLNCRPLSIQDY